MSFHQRPQVTLVVPGLLGPVSGSFLAALHAPDFRPLSRFLARSDRAAQPRQSYFDTLFALFRPIDEKDPRVPVAAVCRYAQTGQVDDAYWLRIDPVHLSADKDRLYMFGNRVLALQSKEARQLVSALQELYADRDWHFEYSQPHQWYLRLAAEPDVRFHALDSAMGHPIDRFMPEGPGRDEWLRFLNEVQMLFHSHEVNNERMLHSEYTANSVWCWGEGRLPDRLQAPWSLVYSNNLFVRGLAALCGIPHVAIPESADELLRNLSETQPAETDRQVLVVLESVEEARIEGDAARWQAQVARIQAQWLLPLLEAQGHRRLRSIVLDPCNGSRYIYLRQYRMRVWRRTHTFGDFLLHA
jgi:hypothetical protein